MHADHQDERDGALFTEGGGDPAAGGLEVADADPGPHPKDVGEPVLKREGPEAGQEFPLPNAVQEPVDPAPDLAFDRQPPREKPPP